jgi:predicted RNA-binding protein with RPS1 domain
MTEAERALIGTMVDGTIKVVHRWGVFVDLGLSHLGFIDPLYIEDDDHYQVGAQVSAELSNYDDQREIFWLLPPGQVPVAERLRRAGHDI